MFHPIIFQIHILQIIQKSFEQNYPYTTYHYGKSGSPSWLYYRSSREYYQRVFIKSSKEEKKLNSAISSHRPFPIIIRYTECPLEKNLRRHGEQNEDRRRRN